MKNQYYSLVRATLTALFVAGALVLTTNAIAQAPPGSLWYNGDFNFVNYIPNERNTLVSQAAVYDDFDVTASQGWHVTAVFSNNLLFNNPPGCCITAADWEIRTGISEGNAGTLVASGTTQTPLVTFTFHAENEFTVEVTGLNVFLPILPSGQHYWLNVTPVGDGSGGSFNTDTSGLNCVGTPCGNDDNAFFNSTFFGIYFTNTNNYDGQPDFSMGVIGTVVPEPATVALLICGVAALLIALRRRPDNTAVVRVPDKQNENKNEHYSHLLGALGFHDIPFEPPQLRGQTLPEQLMDDGYGFEPVVNCDRRTDSTARVQYVWTDGVAIYRRITHDLGADWLARATLDSSGDIDPFAACDIWSTDTTVSRIMYFGWLGSLGSGFANLFARSLSETDVDSRE